MLVSTPLAFVLAYFLRACCSPLAIHFCKPYMYEPFGLTRVRMLCLRQEVLEAALAAAEAIRSTPVWDPSSSPRWPE